MLRTDNMDKIKIATGSSRTARIWKNTELTWEDILARINSPTRTSETMAEYKNMPKAQQGGIKDVGGFVGGVLKDGKRNNQSVMSRHILTLDADFATLDFIKKVEDTLYSDYIIYTTHTHTPENPRYRLIVALDRVVTPDEYQAVSRRIALLIGIDFFDDSTFEPARLMYWPSVSRDGEYLVHDCSFMGGLEVGKVLSTYEDWQDVTQWPVSSRVDRVRKRAMTQADPLNKPGIIGMFCKTYTIQEAIDKYLSDVYAPCNTPDRYTYCQGTTTAGLVIYDDKFAFSNHGTDPAGGQLCNAFDLVRIHLYNDLDNEAKEGTPNNKLPSFVAISDLISNEPDFKKQILEARMAEAQEVFSGLEFTETDNDWITLLDLDSKGRTTSTIQNIKVILENDPYIKDIAVYDVFDSKLKLQKDTPWRAILKGETWTDRDDSGLRLYLEKSYGIYAVNKTYDAFNAWVEKNKKHPVRDYLDVLIWDGTPRVENLLIDYLGADNDDYTKAVTRKVLSAAVARIYNPGCKFDNMLVLVGEQGVGKSTLISKLGMEWYSDSLTTVQGKEGLEQIQGFWLIEMGELKALSKWEEEAVKLFLSKKEDSYRAAYGRNTECHKRQCIFIGTTNKEQFLKDTTGNRRFWPINLTSKLSSKSVFEIPQNEINQIWAEAKEFYKAGEKLHLEKDIEAIAKEKQSERIEENPYAGITQQYLNMLVPSNWEDLEPYMKKDYFMGYKEPKNKEHLEPITRICAMQIWCEALGGEVKTFNKNIAREINDAVKSIKGWESTKVIRFKGVYGVQRGFLYTL